MDEHLDANNGLHPPSKRVRRAPPSSNFNMCGDVEDVLTQVVAFLPSPWRAVMRNVNRAFAGLCAADVCLTPAVLTSPAALMHWTRPVPTPRVEPERNVPLSYFLRSTCGNLFSPLPDDILLDLVRTDPNPGAVETSFPPDVIWAAATLPTVVATTGPATVTLAGVHVRPDLRRMLVGRGSTRMRTGMLIEQLCRNGLHDSVRIVTIGMLAHRSPIARLVMRHVFSGFALVGRVDVLEQIVANGDIAAVLATHTPWSRAALHVRLAAAGHTAVFALLVRLANDSELTPQPALGTTEVSFCGFADAFVAAARGGHLETLQVLWQSVPRRQTAPCTITNAMTAAAVANHLDVLRWLDTAFPFIRGTSAHASVVEQDIRINGNAAAIAWVDKWSA
jgi:hypothetical protein